MIGTIKQMPSYVKYGIVIPTAVWFTIQLGRFGWGAGFEPAYELYNDRPAAHLNQGEDTAVSSLTDAIDDENTYSRGNLHEDIGNIKESELREEIFSGQKSLEKEVLKEAKGILATRFNKDSRVINGKQVPVRNRVLELEDAISDLTQYDDYITEACDKYDVDKTLAYAVMKVESWSDERAVSKTGAAGLFQLTTATARGLGLEVNSVRDERLDPEKAIDAGVRYIKKLQEMFGKQYLVQIAWNYGMGNTNKLKKYWNNLPKLYMHIPDKKKRAEVMSHVRKVLATEYLLLKKKIYGLSIDKKPLYSEKIADARLHTVRKGDTLYKIAREYHMDASEIKELNPGLRKFGHIRPRMKIRVH